MPTLLALANKYTREWGEPVSDTETLNQVKEWIQDGYKEIASERDWDFLRRTDTIETVASTRVYSLSASASEVTYGRIVTTDDPVEYIPKEGLVKRGLDLEQTGAYPTFFYNEGYDEVNGVNQIGLWPIPIGIVSIEFEENRRAEELSDTSMMPLPSELLSALKYYVRAEQARDDKDFEEYDRELARFYKTVNSRKKRFKNSPPAHRPRLRVSDVPVSSRIQEVRFDPNHFHNS